MRNDPPLSPTYTLIHLEQALRAYALFELDEDGRKLATMLEEDLNGLFNATFPLEHHVDDTHAQDGFATALQENKHKYKDSYIIWSHMMQELASARIVLENLKNKGELNGQEQKLISKALDRIHIARQLLYPKGTTYVRNFW